MNIKVAAFTVSEKSSNTTTSSLRLLKKMRTWRLLMLQFYRFLLQNFYNFYCVEHPSNPVTVNPVLEKKWMKKNL